MSEGLGVKGWRSPGALICSAPYLFWRRSAHELHSCARHLETGQCSFNDGGNAKGKKNDKKENIKMRAMETQLHRRKGTKIRQTWTTRILKTVATNWWNSQWWSVQGFLFIFILITSLIFILHLLHTVVQAGSSIAGMWHLKYRAL